METLDTNSSLFVLLLAGLSGILVVLVLALLVQRWRRARDRRPRAQIDADPPAPAPALDEVGWLRRVADISATIELEEVLLRALAAAEEVPGVDAALLVIDPFKGSEQLLATVGTSAAEGGILEPPMLPSVTGARAAAVHYRYTEERADENGTLLREGLVLPIVLDGEPIGSLAVFSRSAGHESDEAIDLLEEIATRSAPAIRNAQRFKQLQTLATHDPVSALHNRSFFDDTLEHETARGSRYGRPLALLILELDGESGTRARASLEATFVEFAESIRGVLRAADVSCRVETDQFAVILPESTVADAQQLYRRLAHKVEAGAEVADRVILSGGVTELSPSDTPASLFQRADRARAVARQAGGGRLAVDREEATDPPPGARAVG